MSISIFPQRVIYKAKTFIAPRKYIEDEVPPEKKNARITSNICSSLAEEKGNSKLNVNLTFLPLTDFQKINSTYYSNNTFYFKINTNKPQDFEGKTICIKFNDEQYRIYDQQKAKIEKIGNNILTVFLLDKDANFSHEFKYSIYIDKEPPEVNLFLNGNPIEKLQNIECKIGSKVEMNSIDKGFHLTHIFFRTKKDPIWKYYHKPLTIEQVASFFIEVKSVDLVGNESKHITFTCKGESNL